MANPAVQIITSAFPYVAPPVLLFPMQNREAHLVLRCMELTSTLDIVKTQTLLKEKSVSISGTSLLLPHPVAPSMKRFSQPFDKKVHISLICFVSASEPSLVPEIVCTCCNVAKEGTSVDDSMLKWIAI
jgi:hypothetical protein